MPRGKKWKIKVVFCIITIRKKDPGIVASCKLLFDEHNGPDTTAENHGRLLSLPKLSNYQYQTLL